MARPIRFHLTVTPRVLAGALAGVLLLAAAADVGTENVTLTTTYPSPAGVYNRIITTGDTYLSRESGRVVVGSSATATSAVKLYVGGQISAAGDVCSEKAASCLSSLSNVALCSNSAVCSALAGVDKEIWAGDAAAARAAGRAVCEQNGFAYLGYLARAASCTGVWNGVQWSGPGWAPLSTACGRTVKVLDSLYCSRQAAPLPAGLLR